MHKSAKIIKKRLAKVKAERGGLAKLSRTSGVDAALLTSYSQGKSDPGLSKVDALAQALGMTTPEFLTDPDNPTPKRPPTQAERLVLQTLTDLIEQLKALHSQG